MRKTILARLSPATLCYATGARVCPAFSQDSAPQTAEPDGATADSGPRLRHRGPRSEHARSPPRPYICLKPLTPTSLRHRRRNRTVLYRLNHCSSSRAASEKGGGSSLGWPFKRLPVKGNAADSNPCLRRKKENQRFDEVVGLRHTVLCRPRRFSAGECGTRAPRAPRLVQRVACMGACAASYPANLHLPKALGD